MLKITLYPTHQPDALPGDQELRTEECDAYDESPIGLRLFRKEERRDGDNRPQLFGASHFVTFSNLSFDFYEVAVVDAKTGPYPPGGE